MSLYYLSVFFAVYLSPQPYIASGILLSYGELADTIEDGDGGDEAGLTSHSGSGSDSAFRETGRPTQVICFDGRKHADWMVGRAGVIMAFYGGYCQSASQPVIMLFAASWPIHAPLPYFYDSTSQRPFFLIFDVVLSFRAYSWQVSLTRSRRQAGTEGERGLEEFLPSSSFFICLLVLASSRSAFHCPGGDHHRSPAIPQYPG